eukprot:TRINITY_DN22659_c0_g2_i1.p1 TRINITY_DN22659_c0_g2~~TRINITY_DN22659_c0_g2_i1.p1  ORF type:complete len:181 (-),score=22.40 TRINITY_DN22659_c0_g2_i1:93-635(-)
MGQSHDGRSNQYREGVFANARVKRNCGDWLTITEATSTAAEKVQEGYRADFGEKNIAWGQPGWYIAACGGKGSLNADGCSDLNLSPPARIAVETALEIPQAVSLLDEWDLGCPPKPTPAPTPAPIDDDAKQLKAGSGGEVGEFDWFNYLVNLVKKHIDLAQKKLKGFWDSLGNRSATEQS